MEVMTMSELKKYVVIVQDKEGDTSYDTFYGAFNTLEEANNIAKNTWLHLSARERSERVVDVFTVKREWLNEDAIDEDGNIDWAGFHTADREDGAFDSETYIREE